MVWESQKSRVHEGIMSNQKGFTLKGSSDAHFTQADMFIYGLNEKSITGVSNPVPGELPS